MAAPREKKPFTPSAYQEAIFRFVVEGRGDAMVSAVAGSGKTTTLEKIAELITSPNSALFAFNKHVAEELNGRLEGTALKARTIHSLGFEVVNTALGRCRVDVNKYMDICRDEVRLVLDRLHAPPGEREKLERQWVGALKKLVELARVNLATESVERILPVIEYYALDVPEMDAENGAESMATLLEQFAQMAHRVCREGMAVARLQRRVDFTDMIWLPNAMSLPCPQLDWMLVDEAQDLNAAQRELLLRCRARGGRAIWVGDPRQAIMGFAGADANSYYTIKSRTDATEFPLSICYRCPTKHIDLAKVIVPEIEASPTAAEGIVDRLHPEDLPAWVHEGDLGLCRTTAPLVSLCIKLIRHRVAARVRGRDVASTLTGVIRKVSESAAKHSIPFSDFPQALLYYRAERLSRLSRREGNEEKMQQLDDQIEAIEACFVEFGVQTPEELCREIEAIFSDEGASVWLSTVHRAKGLEARRVFILHEEKMPLRWPDQQRDQLLQEWNLRYVALTRAKEHLCFIDDGAVRIAAAEAAAEGAGAQAQAPLPVAS